MLTLWDITILHTLTGHLTLYAASAWVSEGFPVYNKCCIYNICFFVGQPSVLSISIQVHALGLLKTPFLFWPALPLVLWTILVLGTLSLDAIHDPWLMWPPEMVPGFLHQFLSPCTNQPHGKVFYCFFLKYTFDDLHTV